MGFLANVVYRICGLGAGVGAGFLIAMMLLIVTVIIVRFFGSVIAGSYEIIELLIVVTVAFALSYTAVRKGHVEVSIVMSRFPRRIQALVASFTWFLSMGIWTMIAWASYNIVLEKWGLELTEVLGVDYTPFRIVWVFGLLLYSLVFLIDLYKALKETASR